MFSLKVVTCSTVIPYSNLSNSSLTSLSKTLNCIRQKCKVTIRSISAPNQYTHPYNSSEVLTHQTLNYSHFFKVPWHELPWPSRPDIQISSIQCLNSHAHRSILAHLIGLNPDPKTASSPSLTASLYYHPVLPPLSHSHSTVIRRAAHSGHFQYRRQANL